MTEEEAKTKWCSQVDRDPRDGTTIAPGQCCIGSACMAWRSLPWTDTRTRHLIDKASGKRITSGTTWDSEWVLENPDEPEPPRHGYCGLAGQP